RTATPDPVGQRQLDPDLALEGRRADAGGRAGEAARVHGQGAQAWPAGALLGDAGESRRVGAAAGCGGGFAEYGSVAGAAAVFARPRQEEIAARGLAPARR